MRNDIKGILFKDKRCNTKLHIQLYYLSIDMRELAGVSDSSVI